MVNFTILQGYQQQQVLFADVKIMLRTKIWNYYRCYYFTNRVALRLLYRCSRAYTAETPNTKTDPENKLLKHLQNKIEATGPITVAEYMKEVLTNPYSGYYMSRDVFGRAGDFITSPEVSQMFGELIGIWFFNEWSRIGQPKPFQLVEFGPGRGTLVEDILRVFKKLNVCEKTFSLHLVEISPHLKKLQAQKLCPDKNDAEKLNLKQTETDTSSVELAMTKFGYPVSWCQHLNEVPKKFSLFLAHEFFDALAIHKFKKTDEGWREILIDCRNGNLQFVLSRSPTPASVIFISPDEKRSEIEICLEGGVLINQITTKMKEEGGISLIVDYGYQNGEKTDTFRAFRDHSLHDPLIDPGKADLTADVDFSFLMNHASKNAVAIGPVTQTVFLHNMGVDIRLERLSRNCSVKEKESLQSGYHMLIDENQMGKRFKFLALYPCVLKDFLLKYPPCGFS